MVNNVCSQKKEERHGAITTIWQWFSLVFRSFCVFFFSVSSVLSGLDGFYLFINIFLNISNFLRIIFYEKKIMNKKSTNFVSEQIN
jgi:uncharacterized membrane protein YobD (UPF0266 family)